MLELKQTEQFRRWRTRLKDERARALIASRLDRLAFGHAGDAAPDQRTAHSLWSWLSHVLSPAGHTVVILLCGGDKGSQAKDIKTAKRLRDEWMK